MRLGFFASGNGSNMQAIIDACRNHTINAVPVLLISNKADSGALRKARAEKISAHYLSSYTHSNENELSDAMLKLLIEHDVDWIILAGYLKLLPKKVINYYKGMILNIHPALLPKYGGKGFYGKRVHQAVIDAGEKETGITIHIVDEEYDRGKIISQCVVPVMDGDDAESLSKRVLEHEHVFFVETLRKLCNGELVI
ncbi:MAG TPA: phosphoribosylglycinamide formyltransferase [Cytophagales bacterium]|nr:phosphoribosylglycinamide formyltransferase [Cytophagales bacterium]